MGDIGNSPQTNGESVEHVMEEKSGQQLQVSTDVDVKDLPAGEEISIDNSPSSDTQPPTEAYQTSDVPGSPDMENSPSSIAAQMDNSIEVGNSSVPIDEATTGVHVRQRLETSQDEQRLFEHQGIEAHKAPATEDHDPQEKENSPKQLSGLGEQGETHEIKAREDTGPQEIGIPQEEQPVLEEQDFENHSISAAEDPDPQEVDISQEEQSLKVKQESETHDLTAAEGTVHQDIDNLQMQLTFEGQGDEANEHLAAEGTGSREIETSPEQPIFKEQDDESLDITATEKSVPQVSKTSVEEQSVSEDQKMKEAEQETEGGAGEAEESAQQESDEQLVQYEEQIKTLESSENVEKLPVLHVQERDSPAESVQLTPSKTAPGQQESEEESQAVGRAENLKEVTAEQAGASQEETLQKEQSIEAEPKDVETQAVERVEDGKEADPLHDELNPEEMETQESEKIGSEQVLLTKKDQSETGDMFEKTSTERTTSGETQETQIMRTEQEAFESGPTEEQISQNFEAVETKQIVEKRGPVAEAGTVKVFMKLNEHTEPESTPLPVEEYEAESIDVVTKEIIYEPANQLQTVEIHDPSKEMPEVKVEQIGEAKVCAVKIEEPDVQTIDAFDPIQTSETQELEVSVPTDVEDQDVVVEDKENALLNEAQVNGMVREEKKMEPAKEAYLSDEELDFDTRYALFVGKILPGHEMYYLPTANSKRKVTFRRGGTLDQRLDTSPLWDVSINVMQARSATLGAPRRHRRRLEPKPSVNDDHLFPDSVTPSKVEKALSEDETNGSNEDNSRYDVPFMDDDAFVPKKYRSVTMVNDDSSNDSDYSYDHKDLFSAEHIAKMDETSLHGGLTAIDGRRNLGQASGSRWTLGLSICGCFRRRR